MHLIIYSALQVCWHTEGLSFKYLLISTHTYHNCGHSYTVECLFRYLKLRLNKKGYIGFVGSQPMLLLFDACLNIGVKAIT